MADYIDQLYEAKRNANTNALKQRRDEQLAQYDTQGAQDTQAYNQGLPQFQKDMNQADVGAFQDTQRLAERAAQSGNYNGGQTDSNLARIMQTASNNKAGFKNQENQFKQNYANNQNTLAGSRARANNSYSSDIAASDMSINADIAQAREQQRQEAAAAARAAASAKAKAAPKPTAGQLKAIGMADVDSAFQSGTTLQELTSSIMDNAAGYVNAGIDYNAILNYANSKYSASQDAYTAQQPTLTQSAANSLTNSAFASHGPFAAQKGDSSISMKKWY